jgi:hypothetical protein
MSDLVLTYLVFLMGNLALPAFILIVASWRVARLRGLTEENFQSRVEESVSDTIREQLIEKVISPLFGENDINLPPGKTTYEVVNTLVPGDDLHLLTVIYHDLVTFGSESSYYVQLIQIVHAMWGGG